MKQSITKKRGSCLNCEAGDYCCCTCKEDGCDTSTSGMKQTISKEQWNELSEEGKKVLLKWSGEPKSRDFIFIYKCAYNPIGYWYVGEEFDWREYIKILKDTVYGKLLTIGQMIEFLDDGIYNIVRRNAGWGIQIYEGEYPIPENWRSKLSIKKYQKELCDALWEAVKYKLKQ